MPAVTASLGVSSITSGIVTKVTTSRKVEVKVVQNNDSSFGAAQAFDPTGEFSVEGQGSYPSITLGVSTTNIPTTISGGVIIIDSFSQTEKSDDFQSWKYGGKHYPGAS
jgi:hypothetical protein